MKVRETWAALKFELEAVLKFELEIEELAGGAPLVPAEKLFASLKLTEGKHAAGLH